MANKDLEVIMDDIIAFLKANLNTQITAMNTEKDDGITLSAINDASYQFQSLNNEVANFDPFILVTTVKINTEGIGPGTKKEYLIQVIVIKSDDGQDVNCGRKILRYGRVLSDIFEQKWDKISPSDKINIQSLEPVEMELLNSGHKYQVIGVQLNPTIF